MKSVSVRPAGSGRHHQNSTFGATSIARIGSMPRPGLILIMLPHSPLATAAEGAVTKDQGAGKLLVVRQPSPLYNDALSSVITFSEEESSWPVLAARSEERSSTSSTTRGSTSDTSRTLPASSGMGCSSSRMGLSRILAHSPTSHRATPTFRLPICKTG